MAPSVSETTPAAGAPLSKPAGNMPPAHPAQPAVDAATARFIAAHPRSAELFTKATANLPGGNTRTLLHAAPFPAILQSGQGYQVVSEDGHVYTDLVGEATAGLYGHSHPVILEALHDALAHTGLSLGGPTRWEHAHAAAICSRFGLENVRFTNSGTEANLHALAAARRFTGARRVLAFEGGYHGSVLGFKEGRPAENNVDLGDWLLVPYNDLGRTREVLEKEKGEVAAVIVEGMQGSGGAIPGERGFLLGVQEAAREAGALFILDEVMTSRLAPGGLAVTLGLSPDLKTFGKWLGGGLAFGAFGGRADVMSLFDPRAPRHLVHNGTFNNNTLAMRAGHAGLTQVYTPQVCEAFTAQGAEVLQRLRGLSEGSRMGFTGRGTIMAVHFAAAEVAEGKKGKEGKEEDAVLKELFYFEMLESGFWVTRRGFLSIVLGTPQAELDRFVESVAAFRRKYEDLLV